MTARRVGQLVVYSLAIIGVWVIFGVFASSEFYRRALDTGGTRDDMRAVLYYQLTYAVTWALFTPLAIFIAERLPLRKPHRVRNAILILIIAPGFSVLRSVLGAMMFLWGSQETQGLPRDIPFLMLSLSIRFHRNIFLFLIIAGVTNLVLLQRAAAERERNRIALQTAVTNAELQRLRTSMQPRLMFSTLDAIAARVTTRPETADRMLVRLGDLLRDMLDYGKRSSVSLAEELEVVDRYFELERERTDGAFTTRIDVEEELLGARVPPLILHPLIESALHDQAKSLQHLDIHGHSAGGMLGLEIRHDALDRTPDLLAMEETRGRLQQAYGDRASLSWRREPGQGGEQLVMAFSIPLELEAEA